MIAQREVFDQVELQHETASLPVLGNVRDTGSYGVGGIGTGDVLAKEKELARRRPAKPNDSFDELRLPVAVDTGDADDLTPTHGERHTPHRLEFAVIQYLQVGDFEERIARLDGVLESHHVTGQHTMLLKVKTPNTSTLEELISAIRSIEGVERTETMVVLSTHAERTQLPIRFDATHAGKRLRKSGERATSSSKEYEA